MAVFRCVRRASLAQVAGLAERVAREVPALDELVNNAAVGFGADRSLREMGHDGLALRFAMNYLAPFPADGTPEE